MCHIILLHFLKHQKPVASSYFPIASSELGMAEET